MEQCFLVELESWILCSYPHSRNVYQYTHFAPQTAMVSCLLPSNHNHHFGHDVANTVRMVSGFLSLPHNHSFGHDAAGTVQSLPPGLKEEGTGSPPQLKLMPLLLQDEKV